MQSFRLPALACDSHFHIFGPNGKYPLAAGRIYTPDEHTLSDYQAVQSVLGSGRAVLVQPSVYGSDNGALLAALATDPQRMRGVAVVAPNASTEQLEQLNAAGVRGARLNLVDVAGRRPGRLPLERLRAVAGRIAPLGWHLELLLHVDEFPELDRQLSGLPVQVVVGHFGYMASPRGVTSAGFKALLRLLEEGRTWVKLSAPYRVSSQGFPYSDITEVAQTLLATAPGRLLWGTDWPHPKVSRPVPDDVQLGGLLLHWIPDPALRARVLIDNPASLYGFRGA